ncbi:MAG TPA: homocysteine S-methyltransferase [Terracidiphilus sp.]|nr:homocysteine S-methyltransferase [Terracidiphilus sp.]
MSTNRTTNDPHNGAIALFKSVRVLDGGLASELEYLGAKIDGPLWSAHVLEDAPEKILAVHRAYIAAGAQCIETASYQVSRMGYLECGLTPERADAALLKSLALAREAAAGFPEKYIQIAVSLGPYGAALHNGAEYHGNYDCTHAELVAFHRERIAVLADHMREEVLAFETLPSLAEAHAIGEALAPWPHLPAWFSFTCRDDRHVAHGERLRDCASYGATLPQIIAIGVNCTQPALIAPLIAELRAASDRPIVVYPNSGEGWDAENRCWTGVSDPAAYRAQALQWFTAGAQMVGGCCRTRPAHIHEVAEAVRVPPS